MLKTGNGRGRRYTELRKGDLVREIENAPPIPPPENGEARLSGLDQPFNLRPAPLGRPSCRRPTDVVHMHRHTNPHAGAHSVLVKFSAAFGHVNDPFPKTVMPRTGCFFEHNAAARRVLGNGSVALSGGGGGRSLRHLRPRQRRRQP